MKFYVLSILSTILFVAGVPAQNITLNTPTAVVQCDSVTLTWAGGTPPVTIDLIDASLGNVIVETYHTSESSSYQTPSIPSNISIGDKVYWTLLDSAGLSGECAQVAVQAGSTNCSSSSASSAGLASGSSTSSSTPITMTSGSTTGSIQSKSTSNPFVSSVSRTSASASTSSTPKGNAAMRTDVPYGAAGILGVLVAAVFA